MQLLSGAITLADLQKQEVSARNVGIVTITAGGTLCVELPVLTVQAGDLVAVYGYFEPLKGGVSGATTFNLQAVAAGADHIWMHNHGSIAVGQYIVANSTVARGLTGIARMLEGGTLTLGSYGWSAASNSTLPAQLGQMYAWLYRGGV